MIYEEVATLRTLFLRSGCGLGNGPKHRAVGVGGVTLETSRIGPYWTVHITQPQAKFSWRYGEKDREGRREGEREEVESRS